MTFNLLHSNKGQWIEVPKSREPVALTAWSWCCATESRRNGETGDKKRTRKYQDMLRAEGSIFTKRDLWCLVWAVWHSSYLTARSIGTVSGSSASSERRRWTASEYQERMTTFSWKQPLPSSESRLPCWSLTVVQLELHWNHTEVLLDSKWNLTGVTLEFNESFTWSCPDSQSSLTGVWLDF